MSPLLSYFVLLFCYLAVECSRHAARMTFTREEASMKISPLPERLSLVSVIPRADPDIVTVVGQTNVATHNFKKHQKMVEKQVVWESCSSLCHYNISVVHKRKDGEDVVVCGSKGEETICCELTLSEELLRCRSTERLKGINQNIRDMGMKEGTHSVLVESTNGDTLFATYSGFQEFVGIHKLGHDKVGPANHGKEQHYKGMMLSRHKEEPLQDKVYTFYNEKDTDTGVTSRMWIPYVTQVCLADKGGNKNELQFIWTSQLSARLFCGDRASKSSFSELVDVATVHAEPWQNATIYALFRNEWSVSAVCVYTVQDIDDVFKRSRFRFTSKDGLQNRPRECVQDSTTLPPQRLSMIAQTTEMETWIMPAKNSVPVFTNHHHYTQIYADVKSKFPVLFLSLNNGGLHKVAQLEGQSFVIAEFRPFHYGAHILSITPHPTSMELYVSTAGQLAVLNEASCQLYGDSCQQCVLARDPQCGWNGESCTSETQNMKQEVTSGDYRICDSESDKVLLVGEVHNASLPAESRYFMQCPMTSRHASYTWTHRGNVFDCSPMEHQCLHLITSMSEDQEGAYKCVSQERGYTRVVAEHHLQLTAAGPGSSPGRLLWACLVVLLLSNVAG